MNVIAGTGHRPNKLGGYSRKANNHLVDLAVFGLQQLKPDVVISGMALGWDLALAQAAWELRIPIHAYVPFIGQESQWPADAQEFYQYTLALCEKTVIVSEGGYSAWKMQIRNEAMVKAANHILAIWDGSSGGTANCVKFAMKCKKPITNLWPIYGFEV